MNISLQLSPAEAELLTTTAMRLGVRPEDLVKATLTDALAADKEEFHKAAEYVLEKNRDLYRRLA
jgi:antitoxin FitA